MEDIGFSHITISTTNYSTKVISFTEKLSHMLLANISQYFAMQHNTDLCVCIYKY